MGRDVQDRDKDRGKAVSTKGFKTLCAVIVHEGKVRGQQQPYGKGLSGLLFDVSKQIPTLGLNI